MRASIFAAIDIYRNRLEYDRLLSGKMVVQTLDQTEDA